MDTVAFSSLLRSTCADVRSADDVVGFEGDRTFHTNKMLETLRWCLLKGEDEASSHALSALAMRVGGTRSGLVHAHTRARARKGHAAFVPPHLLVRMSMPMPKFPVYTVRSQTQR